MYEIISETRPKARKQYNCIWCPEKIQKGEVHFHEVSKYDGEFQDHRWHLECEKAAQAWFRESRETEFEPHACKRGTNDEA